MYDDPVAVFVASASSLDVSNGLINVFNGSGELTARITPIKVHKVVVEGVGTNALKVELHHASNSSGTAVISLAANETYSTVFSRYNEADFYPPIRFNTWISIALTGVGTYRIYYTRS
jgi:hypothetical protein